MATETVPASDDVALAEIADLAARLGETPGRNKLMDELGWGASRSSRLLKLYRDQSSPDEQTDDAGPRQSALAGQPALQTGETARTGPVAQSDAGVDHQTAPGPRTVDRPSDAGPTSATAQSPPPVRAQSAQATPQTTATGPEVQTPRQSDGRAQSAPADGGQTGRGRTGELDRTPAADQAGQTVPSRPRQSGPAPQTAPVWTPIPQTGPAEHPSDRTGRVDRQPWGLITATLAISLSAFVAVWGGWVGLGKMAGFGTVNLLPGIGNGLMVNLAITLPIGIEAYAAAALYVAVAGIVAGRARWFAALSAGTALMLGAFGQAAFHLLEARGVKVAPDGIVVFVSVLPVFVLGAAGVLLHLVLEARKH